MRQEKSLMNTSQIIDVYFGKNYKQLLIVARRVAKRNDYEDLVHETYFKCRESQSAVKAIQSGGFENYFAIAIRNILLDKIKREKKIVFTSKEIHRADTTDNTSRIFNEVADAAVRLLPSAFDRQIIELRALGYSYEDISTETGIPVKYLRRAMYEAAKRATNTIKVK